MDSKKMMVIAIVAIVVVAAVGIGIAVSNNNKSGGLDSDVEIRISYLNLEYYPFMVGFEKGMFKDIGFKVTPVVVSGSGKVSVESMLAGASDIAATGDGPYANTYGKYKDKIVGLCQTSEAEGSLAGHNFITTVDMKDKIDAIEKDSSGTATNGQKVADQIKAITVAGEGSGPNGMFTFVDVKGSTTETNLMKWCIKYGVSFTQDDSKKADIYIHGIPNATADILASSLDTYDAVACNKTLYSNISQKLGDKIYMINDSSCLIEASYYVLCTTKENYDKYEPYMMKILEKIKEINEWIDNNKEEAMQIVADLSGSSVEAVTKNYNSAEHKVIWSDNLQAWVTTASINGYDVTLEQFIQSCPHRDVINGWYD